MEAGAQKLLESATQRTLHAHAFSRSSSQASLVLTDLLARYLTLLTSTCAKYAQHAGRTGLSVHDVLGALEELGVSLEELSDYCATEGKELNRYAHSSIRRVEDLHEFRTQLSDGLRQDHDDAIPLEYAVCPPEILAIDEDDEEDDDEDDEDPQEDLPYNAMMGIETASSLKRPSHLSSPPPTLPTSNPSSPRKRPRISNWEPPAHIPDFLPPFPTISDDRPPSPAEELPVPQASIPPPPIPSPGVRIEKPIAQSHQPVTTSAASDILVQVPYSQSSLSAVPEWHLPSGPPPAAPVHTRQVRLSTPQVEPALLGAFHHILVNPPSPVPPPLNPARHKVAMALMHDSQTNPRWTPADSLFGNVAPCSPRVAIIGPSFPIAIGENAGRGGDKGKDGKDKDTKLPPMPPRPVVDVNARMAPFVSQQSSRVPDLARQVLPSAIFARTSRLSHPPALYRDKAITYGPGIPAPWNANALPSDTAPVAPAGVKGKETAAANGKDAAPKPLLPDARLYATWDYETKDFRVPLAGHHGRAGRARVGSLQAGGGTVFSLPISSRTKGIK